MTVRHVLIGLNLVAVLAIVAYLIWAVLSPKRASEETSPANLTPFLADDDLESRRLERVQGWALLFAAIVAVALPLYWLHEPSRQKESVNYFVEERGRARRDPLLELVDARRTTRRSRSSARTATAPNGPGRPGATFGERQAGDLAGAAAQHGARALPGRPGVRAARRPAARRHGVQRHQHHHLRPARHADAGVGCRRRRPEERAVDPGPRRVPAHDPAEARRRSWRSRRRTSPPRSRRTPSTRVPAVHDVPGRAGGRRARRRWTTDTAALAVARTALQKALEAARRHRRGAHRDVQRDHRRR